MLKIMYWLLELPPWLAATLYWSVVLFIARLIYWFFMRDLDFNPPKGRWYWVGKFPIFIPDRDDKEDPP